MRTDEKPPTKAAATFKAQQLFVSAQRAHTEGVNAFYCRLMRAARSRSDVKVGWEFPGNSVYAMRSDANVSLTWADGRLLEFWFEHDRGTETLHRLADKVKTYKSIVRNYHYDKAVLLIEVPGPGRLANLLPMAAAHWKDSTEPGTRPTTLTVAVSAATAAEQTSTRPENFPDTLEDRRWHVVGTGEVVSLAELPAVAEVIANRPVIWD